MFHVKSDTFEGPLDLLLRLIEKRKLFINDISLAQIADDYIEEVEKHPELPVADTANFIFIASTLVLIKSRSLLPTLSLTNEEEGDIENLKRRLEQYARTKELSVHVEGLFGKRLLFPKGISKNTIIAFAPGEDVALHNIFERLASILSHLPKKEAIPKAVIKKMVSLEDTMAKLLRRIESHLKTSFKKFSGLGRAEKANVIVSFLAVLELIKRGSIHAEQEENFADIEIETWEVSVPRY
ncbi:MAG: segregation/condensation protein A [Parcubacteria group bacterium]|nr:segregation/condensation protein A [Parcubacteria group bacterium]